MASIVLADVRTACERQVVAEWAAANRPDAELLTLGEIDFATTDEDTELIPARVVWLPPVRRGERRGFVCC